MNAYQMGNLRVIDLSKEVDPATESRRCKLHRFNTGGPIPDFHTDMDVTSHLGTHVECPYHHEDHWPCVMQVPLTSFLGRAVYLNVTDSQPRAHLTGAMMEKVAEGLREGDIVILDSCYRIPPFTPLTNTEEDKRLRVNGDTARWLRERGVKAVGFGDGVSIESCNEDVKPFHDILLAENIVFIEVLKNLELLEKKVFFLSFAPLPIRGLDSSPVRVYAIEGLAEFS